MISVTVFVILLIFAALAVLVRLLPTMTPQERLDRGLIPPLSHGNRATPYQAKQPATHSEDLRRSP